MPSAPPLTLDPSAWDGPLDAAVRRDLARLAPRGARLLVVGAHPDDETIGAGRLVADWAARIGPVDVVVLTAGEACFGDTGEAAEAVARSRLVEWEAAVTALGATPRGCARLPDHALAEHESAVHEIVATLAPAVNAIAVTWWGDPHPDHAVAGRVVADVAARQGVALLPYPVWTTYRRRPEDVDEALTVVATSTEADRARDVALRAYRSQLEPQRGREPVVAPEMLSHHRVQLLVGAPA